MGAAAHVPSGFPAVAKNWDGICSYAKSANGNHALCNVPSNTHSWQAPSSAYKKFMCGKIDGAPFTASLGAKNGVPPRTYDFQVVKASSTSGRHSDIMIKDCGKAGMKPVCDHPSYCKTDKNAIYLGQNEHIAYPGHRNDKNRMPSGFDKIAKQWNGLCSYTAGANGNHALCNVPSNTHSWQNANGPVAKFMCGKVDGAPFEAS